MNYGNVPDAQAPESIGSPYRPRPPYQHHAGYYRSVDPDSDLSRPWVSTPRTEGNPPMSPMTPVFNLPEKRYHRHHPVPRDPLLQHSNLQHSPNTSLSSNGSGSSKGWKANEFGFVVGTIPVPSSAIQVEKDKRKKKGLWNRIVRFLRGAQSSNMPPVIHQAPERESPNPYAEKVPLHEWKQYGYWARPWISDVQCVNSPVGSEISLTTEALGEAIANVRDPDGRARPERWLVGAKHRAFPSRPARWAKDPDPELPLPFPWEVQVNPLLQHLLWGPPPLSWCVTADPYTNLFYGRTPFTVRCQQGDYAQPATYPFLTAMHFNAVMGDHAYTFPWSFTVYNPKGIKVGNVLAEIYHCFRQPVLDDERQSWDPIRQSAARKTKDARCRLVLYGERPLNDILRRSDALGAIMWFRGIEPSVNGSGWMIAFGTY